MRCWPPGRTTIAEQRELFTIRLGAVPTGLLLAAKGHIDNVVRELTLIQTGGARTGELLAPGTAQLIETVTQDFAEARAAIKRQAVGAAARGELTTDLVLHLPLASADAGERYLHALEEVDRYAHAARLLTLAPPASHQAFRRWYVQALVDQLRAAAQGLPQPVPDPFPQVLAAEVDRLSLLQESSDRLQLLQRVTTELTSALTVTDVAVTVVNQASAFPGVETARVFQVTDHRTLRSLAFHGENQPGVDPYQEFSLDADLPGAVAARTGESLFLRGRAQIYERFPLLTGYYPTERSLHVAPLRVGEHTLGLLTLTLRGRRGHGRRAAGLRQSRRRRVGTGDGTSPGHRVGRSRDAGGHAGQRPLVVPRHGVGRPVLQPRAPRDGRHRDRPAGAPVRRLVRAHHGHGQPVHRPWRSTTTTPPRSSWRWRSRPATRATSSR